MTPQFQALIVDVIIVNQFSENQGKIIIIKVVKKDINSFMPKPKLFLRLKFLNIINVNERKNITTPVGLIKNIKPNAAPARL